MQLDIHSSAVGRKRPKQTEQQAILEAQDQKCFYCGTPFGEFVMFRNNLVPIQPHWDHILAYSYCFNNSPVNFVACCRICNQIKYNKVFDTIIEVIKYVRQRRIKKGLAVFPLRTKLHAEKKLAEVLQQQMSSEGLLETPSCYTEGSLKGICEWCGKEFYKTRAWKKYCNSKCRWNAWGERHPRA